MLISYSLDKFKEKDKKFFVEICTKIICSIKKVIKMTFSPKKFIKIRRIFGKNVEKYK